MTKPGTVFDLTLTSTPRFSNFLLDFTDLPLNKALEKFCMACYQQHLHPQEVINAINGLLLIAPLEENFSYVKPLKPMNS